MAIAVVVLFASCGQTVSSSVKVEKAAAGAEPVISEISPTNPRPNETVIITGSNFVSAPNISVRIILVDGSELEAPLKVASPRKASFVVPATSKLADDEFEVKLIQIVRGSSPLNTYSLESLKLPTPVFSPQPGSFAGAQTVTIATEITDGKIYYTTDGGVPTKMSREYTGPITVSSTQTIKAVVMKNRFNDSNILTGEFMINGAVGPVMADIPPGIYTSARAISLSTATGGASIYYTLDGSTPTKQSTLYTGSIMVAVSQTIKAIALKEFFYDSNISSFDYTITGTVVAPAFSIAAGSYGPAQTISITSATPGASIYYTTDGSSPSTSSTLYQAPVIISSTQVLKAFAVKQDWDFSSMTSASYTINGTVGDPGFSISAGSYGPPQTVTLTSSTPGATIYYTTNGATPTTTSTLYTIPILVSSNQTIKAIAVKSAHIDSNVSSAAYVINGLVDAPTFSPLPGGFGPSQSVTLTSATPGATIYYTLDGSAPTSSSSVYSAPISITATTTIKAFAASATHSDSNVSTGTFTINGTVSTPTFSVAAGSYGAAQSVSLSSTTPGVTIYYTTDGTTPSTGSLLYTGPITVAETKTITAFAIKNEFSDSVSASAEYVINGGVAAPSFSVAAGAYGPAQSVAISSTTAGTTIYYTTDGSTPTTSSSQYAAPLDVSVSQTLKAFAVKSGFLDSSVTSATYTINGAASAPTFGIAAGEYGPTQSVTLTSATAGAKIYYTLDGSTPTTSSILYSAAVSVASTLTIKAIATKDKFLDSSVSSAEYIINGAAAAPTFSLAAGSYGPAQTVSLASATAGAAIYYTTNGSNPTTSSSLYASPLNITATQNVKAIAVKANYSNSSVSSATYTINGAVAAPTFSKAAGPYGPAQSISLASATTGATIYFTTDGTDPTTASTVYSAAINVASTQTIKAMAAKEFYVDSAISSAEYIINGTVGTPTFNPPAGGYGPAQSVTISSSTDGATIYYTTNGTTPTTSSTVYSAPITVSSTRTIRALAVKANFINSSLASATYTINGAVATPTFSLASGSYGPPRTVTISTSTPGSTIYYTTDGTDPTILSTPYTASITVATTQTVKAFATKSAFSNSAVASASYTINGPAATPVGTPAPGVYTTAQAVTLSSSTAGATIYYTTDGSTPTTSSTLYADPVFVGADQTIKAIAVKTAFVNSSVGSLEYRITGTVQDPTFTPTAGAYGPTQTVTLSSGTPGSTIYYTLDGSDPTTSSTVYSSPITVSETQTIKSFAIKAEWADSAISTGTFTINGAVAAPTFSLAAGEYGPAQTVVLTSATPGAKIYYTTNGQTPSASSLLFATSITVSATQTIKAIAVKDTFSDSPVASATYTINGPAATPTFSVATGSYGPAQSVTISSATAGATIYYTTDGTTPSTSSNLYSSAITVATSQTVKAMAVRDNYSNSSVATAVYTINGAAAAPTFSIPAGGYGPAQSITLSTTTTLSKIYYTIDGTDPTTASTLYSTAISVPSTRTIKAIATKTNFSDSSISSATYTINGAVATPAFSIPTGAYGPAQTLTLSTTTDGATIYYTTNGANPTTSSTLYTAPITISTSQMVKAIAVKSAFSNSSIASASYTINGPAAAPAFSVPAGGYGPAQSIALTTATSGSTIYYTTDGSDPTTSSTAYSVPITVSTTQTIKAIAAKTYFSNSSIASATYTINGAAAAPTFGLASDAYASTQYVTLSSATAGATIYYTTDGSTPTSNSAVYSTAIEVAMTQTIKAFATRASYSDSAVSSADYTINGAAAAPTFGVAAGAYGPAQSVTLSSATAGASIYYTIDGSNPTTSSLLYSTAINVSTSQTIKAIAVKTKFLDSAVASASYTINGAVAAPTFSIPGGGYGPAQTVELASATTGAKIYYTTNGSTPTTASTLYSGPITVSTTQTIKALATKTSFSNSSVSSATYTINGSVAAPTFGLPAGSYGPAQTVSIATATSGATIYYSTDGSTPTTSSTLYTGDITVSTTQTITAIAVKNEFRDSSVSSATYTINGAVAAPTFSVASGAYGPTQSVTLSTATPGAIIYYTINGTTPTTGSSVYSSAISVSTSRTIKAFAVKANFIDSSVASADYTINGAAAAPTFSVAAGSYGPAQSVALSSTTSGASIYYTTDGSTPTTSSTLYSAPITVSSTQTLKAFAVKSAFSDSTVSSASYTINGAVATPTATPSPGIYTTAKSVTLSTATAGASIYYTTDGSTPTTASTLYSSAIFVGVDQTIKAIGVRLNYSDSAVASLAYQITGTVQTPTFSPGTGSYGPAQSVTISSATPGATIYYTTDGTTPTTLSTLYTGAITVSGSQTLKAIATKTDWANSSTGSATYTINGAVATPTFSVAEGFYSTTQSVILATATSGATIYYTTDGTTPTTSSSVYSSPINVSTTQTIKALGVKSNFINSSVASATYTFAIQISNATGLQNIANCLNCIYAITSNINLSGVTWTPIVGFTGTLDGQNYTISNFSITTTGTYAALFATVSSGGVIKNLKMVNATVSGGDYNAVLVGSLASGATITNVSVAGSVSGTSSNSSFNGAAGLVAANLGAISRSSAAVTITLNGPNMCISGGLVANHGGGSITNSYATGNITTTCGGYDISAGGLVGSCGAATITNSYSTGIPYTNTGTNVGGLVGWASGCTTTASYWNTTSSGKSTSARGTGLTDANMRIQGSFSGWDFTTIWQILSGAMPTLR